MTRLNPLLALLFAISSAGVANAQQDAVVRGARRAQDRAVDFPVLISAEVMNERAPLPRPLPENPGQPNRPASVTPLAGADGATPTQTLERPADDVSQPRPLDDRRPLPFADDRPALEVDGTVITTGQLNELVAYYRSFRPGADDLLLRDAIAALVPAAVMQARYAEALPEMRARIQEALDDVRAGEDFAQVVASYSDDDEAPTQDGRYEFGRERAVQPFDRLAHTTPTGQVTDAFLTRYGFHFLEVVRYERGPQPAEDRTVVRHVLVMYPFESENPREEIEAAVADCKIRVLEPGLRNAVPPDLRGRIGD